MIEGWSRQLRFLTSAARFTVKRNPLPIPQSNNLRFPTRVLFFPPSRSSTSSLELRAAPPPPPPPPPPPHFIHLPLSPLSNASLLCFPISAALVYILHSPFILLFPLLFTLLTPVI
ncbi:hypothetical protein VNO78_01766 [Psophocarpus tetragonolobus]|uniref:Uncharacterized protein n=1 Tax=Psophocarpus tetragonolobus TaxID=3891 RepID=A0AAN9TAP3_PSOTE